MAENSSNGHSNGHAPAEAQPLAPRVAAPEGARAARAFDGSPIEIAAPEIAPAATESPNARNDSPKARNEMQSAQDEMPNARNDSPNAQNKLLKAQNESLRASNESLNAQNELLKAQNGSLSGPNESPIARTEAIEPSDLGDAPFDSPMVADYREAFALAVQSHMAKEDASEMPDLSGYAAPPLGISIEKIAPDAATPEEPALDGFEEELPSYDSYPLAAPPADEEDYESAGAAALGLDSIEGEQLFAGEAETDDAPLGLVSAGIGGGNGNGGEPPPGGMAPLGADGGASRPDTPRDQELGLMEHLRELRSRLIYGIVGVMLMMCLTWHYSLQLQEWFAKPIRAVLSSNGITKGFLMITDPTQAFSIYFQFSLTSALILAMPWVSFQVWRFIEPAMTNSERRYTLILVPFSSALFFTGAALGYALSPLFFQFFLQFQPEGVAAQWNYVDSITLMAKMLLIFGLAFQVPIIIIFGNKVGLISRNLLIEYWRHAVVVIFIVVAILTPTWDPFTMTACALPPCLLYLLSIWLVKWI